MTLTSYVLIGTILSHDPVFATIQFSINPETNGKPGIAVMPISAIPCEVNVGGKVFVVKNENNDYPVISCEKKE